MLLIKKLFTGKNHYVYFPYNNKIYHLDKLTYELLDYVGEYEKAFTTLALRYPIQEIENKYNELNSILTRNSLLGGSFNITFGVKSEFEIKDILEHSMQQLVIELTTRCNFSCSYCKVAGRYGTRKQSDIPIETAISAVDYYFKRAEPGRVPTLGFYGGEPLLRFEVIREVICYIKKTYSLPINITLTTNGSLLTARIIEYLAKTECNPNILISLDGPKVIHDRYRKYHDGRGTFDDIRRNLDEIQDLFPDFYKNNISFAAVIAPPVDAIYLSDYFYNQLGKGHNNLLFSFADTWGTSFISEFCPYGVEIEGIDMLWERYVKALVNNSYRRLGIERKLFERLFYRIENRKMCDIGASYPPEGTCLPGKRKLFVNVDGNFYMCEKVYSNYSIGDANAGIDYAKVHQFLLNYEKFFEKCKYCWALRLCFKCFNSINNGDSFDSDRRESFCSFMKDELDKYMTEYCRINEQNERAFDAFVDIHYQ